MSVLTTQTQSNIQRGNGNGHLAPVAPVPFIPATPATSVDSSMSLQDILGILNRRKLTILLTLLSILAATMLYTFSTKPSYLANAVIQIEREGADIINFGNTPQTTNAPTGNNDPFFRTRYEMLRGRVIANRVIEELNLHESLNPREKNSVFSISGIKKLFGLSSKKKTNQKVDYASLFSKKLSVQAIEKTHLVQISYEAPSPDEARNVVTSLIDNYIKTQIETKSETGEYAKNFLGQKLAEAKTRLKDSEEALVGYANENGILGVDDKQDRHLRKLTSLDEALVQAEIKRIEAESLYQQMKRVGSVSTVLTNPVITSLKARLVQLEGDYQEMLKTFKPNYPDMKRLQQQINNARSKLRQEMGNIKNSMEADYLASRKQETKIRNELSQFNKKMFSLQDSSLAYNTLKREVQTNEKLYNTLLQRFEEVNVTASSVNTSNISIVEPAVTPFKPYRPRPKLNLLLGLLSGLILGLGMAFLREALDQSVKSPEDLERISGLPVLGLIPRVTKSSLKKNLGAVVRLNPRTAVAEAYRLLATNMRFMIDSKDERVILITSVNPREGKSTTATNIAFSYAQMGLKVLLVDADIRKPSLHARLGLSNKLGLSNYLKGEVDLVGITQPVKDIQGLYAITAGKYDTDPISLLSHERMSYLTTQGASIFDYVIIDAPPILGFADTLVLSSLATSTIIVAKENMLKADNIQTVLKQLYRVKQNVLGILLVDVKKTDVTAKLYTKYKEETKKLLADKRINLTS